MNDQFGSMRRIDEQRGAVRVEHVYDTDLDDLWSAITEPDRLARWVATVEGDLRLGGTSRRGSRAAGKGQGASTSATRRITSC